MPMILWWSNLWIDESYLKKNALWLKRSTLIKKIIFSHSIRLFFFKITIKPCIFTPHQFTIIACYKSTCQNLLIIIEQHYTCVFSYLFYVLFHLTMIILYTLLNKLFIWCYQFLLYNNTEVLTLFTCVHVVCLHQCCLCLPHSHLLLACTNCTTLPNLHTRVCTSNVPYYRMCHRIWFQSFQRASFTFFVLWNSSSSRQKRQFSGLPLPYHLATCRPFHLIFSFPLFSEHFWRNVQDRQRHNYPLE